MKKELVIEMEEECIDCPMLELETVTLYCADGGTIKTHDCKNVVFCQAVRDHWEDIRNLR